MEDPLMLKKNTGIPQSLGAPQKSVTAQESQGLNQCHRFKAEKANLSYADLHHQITKHISPKPLGDRQKQHRKAIEEEELVKYMSKLPSYLEKGENSQEKVLNVGVLDWRRLEKWQGSQKHIPHRSSRSRHSLSTSNSSPLFFSEGSPAHTSRGQCDSPPRQGMRRPSLQFHLMSSPIYGHSPVDKPLEASVGKSLDFHGYQASTANEQGQFIRTDQPFPQHHSELKWDPWKRNGLYPKHNPESQIAGNRRNCEVVQCMKVKTKAIDGKVIMRPEKKLQEGKANVVDQDAPKKSETVVVLLPRDLPQRNHSEMPRVSEFTARECQKETEPSRRSFSEMPKENFHAVVSSDVPHSCPLPCEIDKASYGNCFSMDEGSVNLLPNSYHSVPHPVKRGSSPSRVRKSGVENQSSALATSASNVPSVGSNLQPSKVAVEKVRSTSPFRQLSISMGKISKTFSSKDGSSIPQPNSTSIPARSVSENAMASSCQATSSSTAQNVTNRARSSPLRRLLDPLLKPKVPAFRGESLSTYSTGKLSNVPSDPPTGTAEVGTVKSDTSTGMALNVNDSSRDKEHRSPTFQALLRVAVKNGQPLFTFAVDNERDILAATMKELSTSREDEYSSIYTFFAIQEVKKKNGRWISQGDKGKGHDYVPNVVAQLKVSGSQFSNLASENHMQQSFGREFVLFAMDLQQAEQQTLEFQPNNELAAIVVSMPMVNGNKIKDGSQADECSDLLNQPIICNERGISATGILPSGVHSLPSKGGPSSLIQRWRSGGSCDCGGWDLGCKLRILTNQHQLRRKLSSSKSCSTIDRFELISQPQGGEEKDQPIFSLASFKDGIYSVEFSSALTILQAFSLCISFLDSKKLCKDLDRGNFCEEKTSLQTIAAHSGGSRALNEGEAPARYVSYPPLSPVGRV